MTVIIYLLFNLIFAIFFFLLKIQILQIIFLLKITYFHMGFESVTDI